VELITTLRLGVLAQRRVEVALRMLQGILLAVTCAIVGLVVAVALGRAAFEHRRSVQGDAKAQGEHLPAEWLTGYQPEQKQSAMGDPTQCSLGSMVLQHLLFERGQHPHAMHYPLLLSRSAAGVLPRKGKLTMT
jgi:hypothetical protein